MTHDRTDLNRGLAELKELVKVVLQKKTLKVVEVDLEENKLIEEISSSNTMPVELNASNDEELTDSQSSKVGHLRIQQHQVPQNSVLHRYTKFDYLNDTLQVFDELPVQIMLVRYVRLSRLNDAHELFDIMLKKCSVIYKATTMRLAQIKCKSEAIKLFKEMGLTGVVSDEATNIDRNFCQHRVVFYFYKKGRLVNDKGIGSKVLECVHDTYGAEVEEDDFTCDSGNSLFTVGAFPRNKVEFVATLNVISSNRSNRNCSLDALARPKENNRNRLRRPYQIKTYKVEISFAARIPLHVITDMYAKSMNMGCAIKLFDEMIEKSEVSWTALIGGYARCGDMDNVKGLFNQMPEKDTAAYNMMIDVFVKLGNVDSARSLFDQMPERNVVSWTTMIDGYCNHGDVASAKLLFDVMPEKNLYSWNAMIGGYCQNKEPHEALQLFHKLQTETSIEPDNVTIVSILPAVADLGALDLGCWIHQYVRKKKLDKYANVCTALIDMYAKCGEITKARTAFDMSNKGIVSWNALINGLAVNGRAKEALEAFSDMKLRGFKPNDVTMIGVLSACNHGGLVEEGLRWFREMQELRLTPKIEHYGCMIDLLGRARCLQEAEKLIETMPYEVNGIILSTFLSACMVAKDVARAERVSKKAATGEAWNDGNYIMLRNIYAFERRWADVMEIKGLMRRKGAKKEVGCSSIEVASRVWEFVSGDIVHPQWGLIHSVLKKLHMNMEGKILDLRY